MKATQPLIAVRHWRAGIRDANWPDGSSGPVQHPCGENRGEVMIDPKRVDLDLPQLDRTDDPGGGAVAWALLAAGVAVVAGILLTIILVAGA